jgi:hypothetical protein
MKSMLFFGGFFSDMVYARVVVFIKDNSFTNSICNIYEKKELQVYNTNKHSQFPNRLKEAQVIPLHKKK